MSKKTSKLGVAGLCEGNPPVTGEFPAQKASDAENVSIWWPHHDKKELRSGPCQEFLSPHGTYETIVIQTYIVGIGPAYRAQEGHKRHQTPYDGSVASGATNATRKGTGHNVFLSSVTGLLP